MSSPSASYARSACLPGSEFIWDGYSFAYSQVAVDTDGLVGALVPRKRLLVSGSSHPCASAARSVPQLDLPQRGGGRGFQLRSQRRTQQLG